MEAPEQVTKSIDNGADGTVISVKANAADARSAATYKDATAILAEAKQIQAHLAAQDAATSALLDKIAKLETALSHAKNINVEGLLTWSPGSKGPSDEPRSSNGDAYISLVTGGTMKLVTRKPLVLISSITRGRASSDTRRPASARTPPTKQPMLPAPATMMGLVAIMLASNEVFQIR